MNIKIDKHVHEASLELERNFITTFRRLARIGGTVTDDGVVVQYHSGLPLSLFNVVLCADGKSPNLAECMDAVLNRYRAEGIPMMWRVGSLTQNQDRVIALLEENGLQRLSGTTAMLLERADYTPPPPSSELTVRLVDSEQTIDDWLVPFAESFGLDCEHGKAALDQYRRFMLSICTMQSGHFAPEKWFVGYCDGKPVSCANYLSDNGVIGLHKIGTVKQFRGRNFAKAMMEVMINHAWERFEHPVVLYASESGREVYRALGFVDMNAVERYELVL